MAASYPQLVLFGDSLFQHALETFGTFSLQGALQHHFWRRLDVVNRGLSGWTSAHAVQHIPHIFPECNCDSGPKMDYLVILFGANDSVLDLPTTCQHVPMEQYKENLTQIINHPRITAHKPKILLVTPPPLDQFKVAIRNVEAGHSQAIRSSTNSAAYSETARQVARENPDVVLIDLQKAIMDRAIELSPGDYQPDGPALGSPENGKSGALNELLPDGLHMGEEAYRIFFNLLRPEIGQGWHGLADDDRTGWVLPDWRAISQIKQ